MSDEVVVIGTNRGTFWTYNRETCRLWGRFSDEENDFTNNPITCVHIHPLRTEYVVVGFQGGQFMICNLACKDKKDLIQPTKLVKDHHEGQALVSVKFCDWIREREVNEESKGAPKKKDVSAWMIASVDVSGRVVISSIRDLAFGILKASKFVIYDPSRLDLPLEERFKMTTIDSRFYNALLCQGDNNDSQTWLAVASRSELQVLHVMPKECRSCFKLNKPTFYPSERTCRYEPFPDTIPVIAWGFGRSPVFKHRT